MFAHTKVIHRKIRAYCVVNIFKQASRLCINGGGHGLAKKSKKEKAAGREQHRQSVRAKKMKKKEKKQVSLPAKHKK
jgi:hypothetical protein